MNKSFAALHDEESNLVARIRSGDEAAFESLYLAHHDDLWRFAYAYVRSRDVAEELVQDVFLSIWGTRATWEVKTRARSWLYASVRHLALNHIRHERVVARAIGAAGDKGPWAAPVFKSGQLETMAPGISTADPQFTIESREIDEAVTHAIAGLPERRRIAMTLRWKHEMSSLEIARVLSTTPEAVRTLLTRARTDLVALLELVRP